MAALTGNSIDSSYQGLLKTTDNGAVGGASKAITDGLGNATNIEIGNAVTKFPSGTVDFTGSTVQGLPADVNTTYDLASAQAGSNANINLTGSDATTDTVTLAAGTNITLTDNGSNQITIDAAGGGGAAGLESGTGSDSMQSASSLTTNAADASGNTSIAIGDGVTAAGADTTSIGKTITTVSNTLNSVMIGTDLSTGSTGSDGTVVIGHNNQTSDGRSVAIGYDVDIPNGQGQAMGNDINITGADRSTAIGSGINIDTVGSDKIGIGTTMSLTADRAIGIGRDVTVSGDRAISIGDNTSATASGSVALGKNVTAATADTVSVKALEVQTDSTPTAGGIIMSDAGGTDRRINIDASGNLQVDSNAVGVTPMFKLPRTTGTSSSGCDVIYSSVLIPANTFAAGDILQLSGAMSASNSANTIWSAYWISTTGTVGGSATEEVNCGQLALSQADWAVGFQKNLYVNVADGTGAGTELVSGMDYTDVDGNVNTAGAQLYTPDWTSNLYLVNRTCIQGTNTGVIYVDHGAVLKKIN